MTALHIMAQNNVVDVMEVLIANRADLDRRCQALGRTALHYAVAYSSNRALTCLVEEGAALNLVDREKNSALHLAQSSETKIWLIKHGARVGDKNAERKSAVTSSEMPGVKLALKHYQTLRIRNDVPGFQSVLKESPEWLPDAFSKTCMGCDAAFGLIRRRHHCRRCGRLFCGACSKKRIGNHRVCDGCFNRVRKSKD